jgi:hypothetical protein
LIGQSRFTIVIIGCFFKLSPDVDSWIAVRFELDLFVFAFNAHITVQLRFILLDAPASVSDEER